MLQVNLIGAGRVGQTLGYVLAKSGLATIQAVLTRSPLSTERALEFIGQGEGYVSIDALPPAELTLIATPDDAIAEVSHSLAVHGRLRRGDCVVHCSGRYDSMHLAALQTRGCWVASMHPLCSIAQPAISVHALTGVLCALEGDVLAVEKLAPLVTAMGLRPFQLMPQHKALYHAASVFAANYVVTLAEQARYCFEQAGIEPAFTQAIIHQLMQSSVDNMTHVDSPADALTGPLQRGDAATIAAHLQVLPAAQRACYVALARATLPLLPRRVSQALTVLFEE